MRRHIRSLLSSGAKQGFRYGCMTCVAALLWGALSVQPATGQVPDPASDIAARSYDHQTLNGILGRSARLSPVTGSGVSIDSMRPSTGSGQSLRLYAEAIERYSREHGVDVDLVRAVIQVESSGNARAVSPRGAAGLMQLMPATARELGVTDVFDPDTNIEAGTRYLRSLLDRFQSVEVALWAYNAGPSAVIAGRLPAETEAYVPRVLAQRRRYQQQAGW